ncbi:putative hydrolase [Companilactobacillus crustorum]|nr:alpha/beta hydrolase [Companilactobacillus crustorum]GEO77136.1 putative hydrolase [Companilactobacillus crustorum]
MDRKIIQLSEIKMAYYDEGQGESIMLLHGFPDSGDVWRKVIPILNKNGYRTIAPDLRGFGQSEAPEGVENYRADKLAKDILELKHSLGIEKPMKLIAHDWGANIGWTLASFFPKEFSSYVALSVGNPYAYALDGGFGQKQKAWYTMAFQTEGFAEKMFSQNDWATLRLFCRNHSELDKHYISDLSRPGRFTAALNLYRANLNPKFANKTKLPKTDIPVLGIYGKNDPYLSESQMSQSVKYVNNTFEYKIIDGEHVLPLDNSQEITNIILNYYRK